MLAQSMEKCGMVILLGTRLIVLYAEHPLPWRGTLLFRPGRARCTPGSVPGGRPEKVPSNKVPTVWQGMA